MKTLLTTLVKLTVVAALLYWLVDSGRLQFSELKIFLEDPSILAMNVALWFFGYVMLGALRWFILVRGLELDLRYPRAVALQTIGFFFNTAMPGSVGGDIIKAVYVMREQKTRGRTRAMLTVLLDRVMGLAALFIIAGAGILLKLPFVMATKAMWPIAVFVLAGNLALVVGFLAVFIPKRNGRDPIARLLERDLPGFSFLAKIYDALCAYRSQPQLIAAAVALSILIQLGSATYSWYVMRALTGIAADPATFASILSIGIMTTALPLAPGGLGVGHVAFDRLFHLVDWPHGANVFNVIMLGQLALHLLGVIPYLFYRAKLPTLDDVEGLDGEIVKEAAAP